MKDRDEKREKEVNNTRKDKIETVIAFIVITAGIILMGMVGAVVILQHGFKKAEAEFYEGFDFTPSTELWDRVPYLSIYPWSEYHKYSTRDLPQEQIEFLKEKRVAECMVDMVNYESSIIGDKESAVEQLYAGARKLLTEDDSEYYVWKQFPIEGVYVYAMVNMKGEIFSFHYVTDVECDEQEAIQYVRDSFQNKEDVYKFDSEISDFSTNRVFYIETISKKLTEYENLDTTIFYKDIDLRKKPAINEENGNAVMTYVSETKRDYFVFLYLDCKTKRVSGYHVMLY